jgi:hypothetical protein
MPRLLRDHGQDDQAELAIVERPSMPPTASAHAAMMMMLSVTAIRHVIGVSETTEQPVS